MIFRLVPKSQMKLMEDECRTARGTLKRYFYTERLSENESLSLTKTIYELEMVTN